MTDPSQLTKLRGVECLSGVAENDLQQLAGFGRRVDIAEGAVVFREGDAATETFLVVSGSVSLEICAPGVGCRRITTIGEGELLGWSPVLDNNQLSATARAVALTELFALPKDEVSGLCERSPQFGYLFMKGVALTLARRLSAARLQILNVFGDESEQAAAGPPRPGRSA
jgi:CRP-like cAMP-binding protein